MAVPRTPAEVHEAFFERLNNGDIDGLVALYERDAVLRDPGGADARGEQALRIALTNLVDAGTVLSSTVVHVTEAADTAVVYADWHGTIAGPCGERRGIAGKSVEVVRRQPAGSWRFIADDLNGRG